MRVLIIDSFEESLLGAVRALPGDMPNYIPQAGRAEVLANLAQATVVIMKSKTQVDKEFLQAAPQLQLIIRAGAGLDHIDLVETKARGIDVCHTPKGNSDAVGEQAVGMLLALLNCLPRANQEVRRRQWRREENRAHELAGRVVGIIGYGHTGSAVARKLSGFKPQVLAYDKYKHNYGDRFAREASLEEIFEQADVLTLHVPLTPETRHMVNDMFLLRFARPMWLLNLSRGAVVDTAAVVYALQHGKLRGVGLDVLENEDFTTYTPQEMELFEQLIAHENVLLSPHIGGWSYEAAVRIEQEVLQILRKHMGASS